MATCCALAFSELKRLWTSSQFECQFGSFKLAIVYLCCSICRADWVVLVCPVLPETKTPTAFAWVIGLAQTTVALIRDDIVFVGQLHCLDDVALMAKARPKSQLDVHAKSLNLTTYSGFNSFRLSQSTSNVNTRWKMKGGCAQIRARRPGWWAKQTPNSLFRMRCRCKINKNSELLLATIGRKQSSPIVVKAA